MKIGVFILYILLIPITFSMNNREPISLLEDTIIAEDAKDEVLLLENLDIDELYKEFLKGKINAQSSFSEEKFLTFYDEEVYEEESVFRKESLEKYFALVDVNSDQKKELIFKVHSGFTVFDNGITKYGQNHTGAEAIYYSYNLGGKPVELIRFFNTGDWESFENQNSYKYNAYCLNENKVKVFSLNTIEEYESLLSAYRVEEKVKRYQMTVKEETYAMVEVLVIQFISDKSMMKRKNKKSI